MVRCKPIELKDLNNLYPIENHNYTAVINEGHKYLYRIKNSSGVYEYQALEKSKAPWWKTKVTFREIVSDLDKQDLSGIELSEIEKAYYLKIITDMKSKKHASVNRFGDLIARVRNWFSKWINQIFHGNKKRETSEDTAKRVLEKIEKNEGEFHADADDLEATYTSAQVDEFLEDFKNKFPETKEGNKSLKEALKPFTKKGNTFCHEMTLKLFDKESDQHDPAIATRMYNIFTQYYFWVFVEKDSFGNTPLHYLAQVAAIEDILEWISGESEQLYSPNESGITPRHILHERFENDSTVSFTRPFQILPKKVTSKNCPDFEVLKKFMDEKLYLDYSMNINVVQNGENIFHLIAKLNDSSYTENDKMLINTIIKILRNLDVNINLQNDHGKTPYFIAHAKGKEWLCKMLAKNGAFTNTICWEKQKPASPPKN